jgi:hypothetical protein
MRRTAGHRPPQRSGVALSWPRWSSRPTPTVVGGPSTTTPRWQSSPANERRKAVAKPPIDPVAALIAAGLGQPGPSTLSRWPADPWQPPAPSIERITAARALWRNAASEVEAAIVARVAALPAEDVHAVVTALVGGAPADTAALCRSGLVWVAALLRPTHPSRCIAVHRSLAAVRGQTSSFDLPTRVAAARGAARLGVKDAAALATDLEKRLDRALGRQGM